MKGRIVSRVRQWCLVSLLSVSILLCPGCSLFVGSTQPVTINASDPQARIIVDGQEVGTGSAVVDLKRNKSHSVVARVDSRQGVAAIQKKISPVGILDLVGGVIFLVPFIGVFGAGFWELEPENVNVIVMPPAAGAPQ